jgi:hypothetical protein
MKKKRFDWLDSEVAEFIGIALLFGLFYGLYYLVLVAQG